MTDLQMIEEVFCIDINTKLFLFYGHDGEADIHRAMKFASMHHFCCFAISQEALFQYKVSLKLAKKCNKIKTFPHIKF